MVAGALSNYNCEGCVSYNMLKLTRLLHFHEPGNAAYMDYYERTLVNHVLGTQDPGSPHGFVAYYTGLSPGAHKQVPANYFPGANENVFATDYDTFTCDTATGLETPTRFTDTIYTRDPDGALRVNLFIPSRVSADGLTFRQATSIPGVPATTLTVEAGAGPMTLRVRVPAWATSVRATLNGRPQSLPSQSEPGRPGPPPGPVEVTRVWRPGDELLVSFGTGLALWRAPQPAGRGARLRSCRPGGPDGRRRAHADPRRVFRPAGARPRWPSRRSASGTRATPAPSPSSGLRRSPPALHDRLAGRVGRPKGHHRLGGAKSPTLQAQRRSLARTLEGGIGNFRNSRRQARG